MIKTQVNVCGCSLWYLGSYWQTRKFAVYTIRIINSSIAHIFRYKVCCENKVYCNEIIILNNKWLTASGRIDVFIFSREKDFLREDYQ